jgi:transcriptional regulator with GAF, ATPase, and Fis domain
VHTESVLADADEVHILATLRRTNGVIGGRNGAAARLGLKGTTLIARMKKLGLSPMQRIRVPT